MFLCVYTLAATTLIVYICMFIHLQQFSFIIIPVTKISENPYYIHGDDYSRSVI